MKRPSTRMGLILPGVLIAVVALATTAAARTFAPAAGPIVIGWAYDSKGAMAPFDNPALAAAQLQVNADEREGRRQRTQAADQDVRHAGQQGGDRQGVRSQAAERRRERDVHDVRRRLRGSGRAGDDQPRRACGRAVHRHRPDGAEAVWREGQAGVQLRQRRAGRRLGDGAVRLRQGLAVGRTRDRHGDRLLQGRRQGVRGSLSSSSAARSSRTSRTSRSAATTCRTQSAG